MCRFFSLKSDLMKRFVQSLQKLKNIINEFIYFSIIKNIIDEFI